LQVLKDANHLNCIIQTLGSVFKQNILECRYTNLKLCVKKLIAIFTASYNFDGEKADEGTQTERLELWLYCGAS
jgi:hypothetical protein